jgi:hypothetical protein
MTQEIILPVTFPDFSVRGVAHGEIRVTATLARPNGGVTLDLDVRGEDNSMVHHMRCVFQPYELIPRAETRRTQCSTCGHATNGRAQTSNRRNRS